MSTPTTPREAQRDRLLDDDLVLPRREGAVHHQDQPGLHLRVLEPRAVEAADRGEDDVVEVALAAAVALHRVEAQLERRDLLRAVRAADRRVHRHLHRHRARLDQLRPVVDLVERVEVRHAARIAHRDEPVEVPVVLHRQRDALLVRQRPEDVGRDRASEVGVQLGETVHRSSVTAAREPPRRVGFRYRASQVQASTARELPCPPPPQSSLRPRRTKRSRRSSRASRPSSRPSARGRTPSRRPCRRPSRTPTSCRSRRRSPRRSSTSPRRCSRRSGEFVESLLDAAAPVIEPKAPAKKKPSQGTESA